MVENFDEPILDENLQEGDLDQRFFILQALHCGEADFNLELLQGNKTIKEADFDVYIDQNEKRHRSKSRECKKKTKKAKKHYESDSDSDSSDSDSDSDSDHSDYSSDSDNECKYKYSWKRGRSY